MWLLSTNRAELHSFKDHQAVDGGYAILSHTWGQNEQTFQDIQVLQEQCRRTRENPRDRSPEKIKQSCLLAERYGFHWIWIDTCCIDKTSSTELSEAINSMFEWYAAAEVCFALLEDVGDDHDPRARDSAFRRARWFTRGWTLQELVAPRAVVFVSRNWGLVGTREDLAGVVDGVCELDTLEGVCGRNAGYLGHSKIVGAVFGLVAFIFIVDEFWRYAYE